MVHELTHPIEGIARHSRIGRHESALGQPRLPANATRPLPFAPEDIQLIHIGMRAREAGAAFGSPLAAPAKLAR